MGNEKKDKKINNLYVKPTVKLESLDTLVTLDTESDEDDLSPLARFLNEEFLPYEFEDDYVIESVYVTYQNKDDKKYYLMEFLEGDDLHFFKLSEGEETEVRMTDLPENVTIVGLEVELSEYESGNESIIIGYSGKLPNYLKEHFEEDSNFIPEQDTDEYNKYFDLNFKHWFSYNKKY